MNSAVEIVHNETDAYAAIKKLGNFFRKKEDHENSNNTTSTSPNNDENNVTEAYEKKIQSTINNIVKYLTAFKNTTARDEVFTVSSPTAAIDFIFLGLANQLIRHLRINNPAPAISSYLVSVATLGSGVAGPLLAHTALSGLHAQLQSVTNILGQHVFGETAAQLTPESQNEFFALLLQFKIAAFAPQVVKSLALDADLVTAIEENYASSVLVLAACTALGIGIGDVPFINSNLQIPNSQAMTKYLNEYLDFFIDYASSEAATLHNANLPLAAPLYTFIVAKLGMFISEQVQNEDENMPRNNYKQSILDTSIQLADLLKIEGKDDTDVTQKMNEIITTLSSKLGAEVVEKQGIKKFLDDLRTQVISSQEIGKQFSEHINSIVSNSNTPTVNDLPALHYLQQEAFLIYLDKQSAKEKRKYYAYLDNAIDSYNGPIPKLKLDAIKLAVFNRFVRKKHPAILRLPFTLALYIFAPLRAAARSFYIWSAPNADEKRVRKTAIKIDRMGDKILRNAAIGDLTAPIKELLQYSWGAIKGIAKVSTIVVVFPFTTVIWLVRGKANPILRTNVFLESAMDVAKQGIDFIRDKGAAILQIQKINNTISQFDDLNEAVFTAAWNNDVASLVTAVCKDELSSSDLEVANMLPQEISSVAQSKPQNCNQNLNQDAMNIEEKHVFTEDSYSVAEPKCQVIRRDDDDDDDDDDKLVPS